MSLWSNAKSTESVDQPAAAKESFDIQCCCGEHLLGVRQVQPQVAQCAVCQEQYLVLPTNPYPPPSAPGKKRRGKKSKGISSKYPLVSTAVVLWNRGIRPATALPISIARSSAMAIQRWSLDLFRRLKLAIKYTLAQFTLLRLIIACILALVGGTIYWQRHQAAIDAAQVQANTAYERGMTALQRHEVVLAFQEFDRSRSAMDLLKRDDALAHKVRQYAKELEVVTRLATTSFFEILDEAERQRRRRDDQSWLEAFSRQYRDEWLVLELNALSSLNSSEPGKLMIPYFGMGTPVALEIPKSIANRIPDEARDHLSLIVAVQWRDCLYEDEPQPRWIIRFNPDTAFMWVNYQTFLTMLHTLDDNELDAEIRRALKSQAAWLGAESDLNETVSATSATGEPVSTTEQSTEQSTEP